MKKTSKIIVIALIGAVLLLGIGYAAIQNITLNILGTATADPSQSNFKVVFSGTPEVSTEDSPYITAAITDEINATINVKGLTEKGQAVCATYTVQNTSADLSADLFVSTTNSNMEYFLLTSEIGKESLISGEATTIKVKVELTEKPEESVSSTIGIQLNATPVQPGEEGTSGATNDYSQTPDTTLETLGITNDNIGEYIDIGNNIIGTETTADDWRILYKDETAVYAILADYLPNNTNYAMNATLNVSDTYNVYSNSSRNALLNGLNDTEAWKGLANGIDSASVTGTPTSELFFNSYLYSYNVANETELKYEDIEFDILYTHKLDENVNNYDLYLPRTEIIDNTYGYWLATPNENYSDKVINVNRLGETGSYEYNLSPSFSVRPVISLPLDITCNYINGVLTIY